MKVRQKELYLIKINFRYLTFILHVIVVVKPHIEIRYILGDEKISLYKLLERGEGLKRTELEKQSREWK